jgi:DNA/RNA-binding domain of Phe-tRNA-synthetase-like protein
MKFRIDREIFDKFQDLTVGAVVAKNVNNAGTTEEIQERLRTLEAGIRTKYNTETLSQTPKIDVWRKTYSAFGAKPKENRSSVENLYRLVLQGTNLRHINKLVDAYNLISLRHTVPVGGEDIDKMSGDIVLTFAKANEAPVLLLGDKEPRPPHVGEVVYKDDISTVCRRWNWREADRTKLTEETKNCILVIEGLPPVTRQEIETATVELKDLIQKFCGGDVTYKILDKNQNEMEL